MNFESTLPPTVGHHVEEDEGENEEAQHGTDDVGVTWCPIGTVTLERWRITNGSKQYNILNQKPKKILNYFIHIIKMHF